MPLGGSRCILCGGRGRRAGFRGRPEADGVVCRGGEDLRGRAVDGQGGDHGLVAVEFEAGDDDGRIAFVVLRKVPDPDRSVVATRDERARVKELSCENRRRACALALGWGGGNDCRGRVPYPQQAVVAAGEDSLVAGSWRSAPLSGWRRGR